MAKQKEITVNGKKKIAKELRADQIRELLDGAEVDSPPSVIDMLYPEAIPAEAAAMSVGMSFGAIEKLAPSDLDAIMEAATEVNPSLAALIKRLAKIGTAAMQARSSTAAPAG